MARGQRQGLVTDRTVGNEDGGIGGVLPAAGQKLDAVDLKRHPLAAIGGQAEEMWGQRAETAPGHGPAQGLEREIACLIRSRRVLAVDGDVGNPQVGIGRGLAVIDGIELRRRVVGRSGALIAAFGAMFKPNLARFLAPVYAIAEGLVVGAISHAYNIQYDGIVLQAVGATAGVFTVMLVLYRTGIIRVNDKFRRIVIGATMGLVVFYAVAFLFSLFGVDVSFFNNGSLLGIGLSLFAAGLEVIASTPQEATAAIRNEMVRMGKLIDEAGLRE